MGELAATTTHVSFDDVDAAVRVVWKAKFGSEPPTNAVELLLSQSALETAAWAECKAFNLGNIKSNGADGDWCFFKTWERLAPKVAQAAAAKSTSAAPAHLISTDPDADGLLKVVFEPKHPACRFRAFSLLAEGAAWYLNFLASHEQTAWPAVLAGDPWAFVHALKTHGYFTASEASYLAGVCRFFDDYGTPNLGDMTEIYKALGELGYTMPTVRDRVGAFQHDNGLKVDYTAGPLTRSKMRVVIARGATLDPGSPSAA